MEKSKANKNLLFAAIDIGSTFSGYAFTIRDTSMKSSVIVNSTLNSSSGGLITLKTPTTLLLDKSLSLLAFGYDAEDVYAELKESGEEEDCHFFPYFKMGFTKQANKSRDFKISDVNGVEIPALQIFTQALTYLKDHLMNELLLKVGNDEIDDQTWVLTFPVELNDLGKEFLINAAGDAGIDDLDLVLVAESEAALLYCIDQQSGEEVNSKFDEDVELFLVDFGGGSVDISVQKIQANKNIEMIFAESSDSFRPVTIDKNFLKAVTDTVGEECIELYQRIHPVDFLEFTRHFENNKGKLNLKETPNFLRVICPLSLSKQNNNRIPQTSEFCTLLVDKFQIDFSFFKSFFEPIFTGNVSKMTDVFLRRKRTPINKIMFMVGGISSCLPLQEMVAEAFEKSRVITPKGSGQAVQQGAVLFGTAIYSLQFSNMKKEAKRFRHEKNTLKRTLYKTQKIVQTKT